MNMQAWFPLGLTGVISMLSKGLSRVFSSTTVLSMEKSFEIGVGLDLLSSMKPRFLVAARPFTPGLCLPPQPPLPLCEPLHSALTATNRGSSNMASSLFPRSLPRCFLFFSNSLPYILPLYLLNLTSPSSQVMPPGKFLWGPSFQVGLDTFCQYSWRAHAHLTVGMKTE